MCGIYHGVSTAIFSNTQHCYHYEQLNRRFSHMLNFIREVTAGDGTSESTKFDSREL